MYFTIQQMYSIVINRSCYLIYFFLTTHLNVCYWDDVFDQRKVVHNWEVEVKQYMEFTISYK